MRCWESYNMQKIYQVPIEIWISVALQLFLKGTWEQDFVTSIAENLQLSQKGVKIHVLSWHT